jgi:hypothetical protein
VLRPSVFGYIIPSTPETQDSKPETRNSKPEKEEHPRYRSGFCLLSFEFRVAFRASVCRLFSYVIPSTPGKLEPRDPKPETRNPKPETRNSKPENSKPENSKPETRNPKPETRN